MIVKRENQLNATKRLTTAGLLTAVTVIFSYIGMIPFPIANISLTFSHIPAIVAGILFGPLMGAVVGFSFGVTALVRALVAPNGILDPLFINPLVSVLPRILIGVVAYYAYSFFARFNKNVGVAIGAIAGSLTNTVGCLGMIALIYGQFVVDKIGVNAGNFFLIVLTSSGVIEMITAAIVAFPLVKVLEKALFR